MKPSYVIYPLIALLVIVVIYLNQDWLSNEGPLKQGQDSKKSLIENEALSKVVNQPASISVPTSQLDYQQELATVKRELGAVKAEMSILKRMISQLGLRTTNAVNSEKNESEEKDLNRSSQEESRKAIESIDASFRQQIKNDNASKQSEQTIQNALVAAKLTAQGNPVIDCRVSMCRVELSTGANQELALEELPNLVGSDFPNMRFNQVIEKDGTVTTVVYMSKDEFNHEATGD